MKSCTEEIAPIFDLYFSSFVFISFASAAFEITNVRNGHPFRQIGHFPFKILMGLMPAPAREY
jgi:hypothetical protein